MKKHASEWTPISGNPAVEQAAVYLQSLGAAGTVTGSKHLLLTPGMNVMIDCGLFQGIKALREKNWEPLPVNPTDIDALILTHAHLDHCGYIPLLVKNGYRKKIYMSRPTRDLAELILRDCAKLQEEDAEKANRHGYSKHHPAKPLYTVKDAEAALPFFEVCEIDTELPLNDWLSFSLHPAGHIPGACSVRINCYGKTLIFSGDIGRKISELLPAPEPLSRADFVIMESTYGDRLHAQTDTAQELALVINDTVFNKGNILIPCFAVGRAQEVMHLIYRLKQQRQIPAPVPEYLDSPMAASAGKVLQHYPEWFAIDKKECARMFNGVTINQEYQDTEKIIRRRGSKIIMAASGMLTGGRVLEYLKHYLGDARNTILLIGFQAEGTRGRALLNQAHEVKIHGQYYPVKAQIREIEGLSAHADQTELLSWLKQFKSGKPSVFLVHGEPCAQEALRVKIKDELKLTARIVKQYEKELLFTVPLLPEAEGK
ncbi:MBL fold metallo-hydrolase RNA specificity domain-containing protein [Mucilaginibacter sp. L3T2-6]|uniref:MBL fold metallo-hydrolase RNA specificity domain-containing protein n=1 Tax=Mucilaginibacter sp. L3T2-6 TaxID=3062491 RepID=UPI0026768369|nr:MBL fold metallo-hydrolase [Mucilaginibacter sp. L3T2-6]MDO3643638.1 MBL fold metallo-hydrolase [Mucilaginibacter sp. L3T2-6]MDV6216114.1 MBL fold metallo-hydrolase [Mucilaginibacter sp. L3T2-6]